MAWRELCLLLLGFTTVIAIADLGQFPSLQIDPISGNIIIVYGSASGLKITTCQPEQCSEPETMHLGCTPPLASASLTLIGGAPFIAYAIMQKSNSAALFGLVCSDRTCSSYKTTKIGSGSNHGFAAAVIEAPSSNPMITYIDRFHNSLAVATCEDHGCQSASIDYPYPLNDAFYHTYGSTDIEFVHDHNHTAVISFQQWSLNGTQGVLQLAVCPSGSCHDSNVYVIDANAAEYTSMALDYDDNVLIAYTDATYKQFRIAACTLHSTSSCIVRTVVTTTQTIMSPAIRSRRFTWTDLPLIAYFQSWSGKSGGALYVLRCRTPRCENENPNNAVLIDSSPFWITSEMQIAIELRPVDGRPVVVYSVYEAPLSFQLKVAICLTESCEFNRIYNIDNFRVGAQITLKFNFGFFLRSEIAFMILVFATIAVALYVPNKARLVNVYTMRPFTRDVLADVNYRNVIGLSLFCSIAGALLSSVSWLLYSGLDEISDFWHIFVFCLFPILSSIFAYSAVLRCSSRNLLLSGVFLSLSLLIFLNLILTYTANSFAFECDTIKIPVPRDLSIGGVVIMATAHLLDLFLCARIYIALKLASPALIPSRWDDDL